MSTDLTGAANALGPRTSKGTVGGPSLPTDEAERLFTDFFVRNYPGPHTVIYNPHWHAPKIFRAAILAMQSTSPAEDGLREALTVGSPVRCLADNCPAEWREDWRDWTGFIAGIHYEPRVGLNYTVCDKWPPEHNGDLSDGFRDGQLTALSKPTVAVGGPREALDRAFLLLAKYATADEIRDVNAALSSSPTVSSNEDAEWLRDCGRMLRDGGITFAPEAADDFDRIADTLETKPSPTVVGEEVLERAVQALHAARFAKPGHEFVPWEMDESDREYATRLVSAVLAALSEDGGVR